MLAKTLAKHRAEVGKLTHQLQAIPLFFKRVPSKDAKNEKNTGKNNIIIRQGLNKQTCHMLVMLAGTRKSCQSRANISDVLSTSDRRTMFAGYIPLKTYIPYRNFVPRKNPVRNSTVRNFFCTVIPYVSVPRIFQPIYVNKNSAGNFCHCHVEV